MAAEADITPEPRVLFTAPWEPVVVRRGDALGLRAIADQFAEAVAPDLSNRVRDGRWVTILAWCLVRSQDVFHASGGRSVVTREEQRARYAWLRPLELMWVARTIALADDWGDRWLAGQRSVRPWYEYDNRVPNRFGMSVDQFRSYRQTGMYGAYRVVFRKWPGMTLGGDGWTPLTATDRLAEWLDGRLGLARPPGPLHTIDSDERGVSKASAKLGRGEECRWWLRQWGTFDQGGRKVDKNTLPRRKDEFETLPEVALLEPLVFGDDQSGKRRLKVAQEVAKSSATEHIEICEHLAQVLGSDRTIALLPRFSRLADAGIAAMDLVADNLRKGSRVALSEIAAHPAAGPICKKLMAAAQEWRKIADLQLRHVETAHQFASAIPKARPIDCLRALLRHHEFHGGGLRWFVLRNGWVEPRTPPLAHSSRYRFRLWSLCRLATQSGVLRKMPPALRDDDEADEIEASETSNE